MAVKAYEVLIQTPHGVRPYSVWAMNDDEAMHRAKSMYTAETKLPIEKRLSKADVATETAAAAGRDEDEMSRYRHARWTRDLADSYGTLPAAGLTALWELVGAAQHAGKALRGKAKPTVEYVAESMDDVRANMAGMRAARGEGTAREQEGMLFSQATGLDPEIRKTLLDDEYVRTDKTFGRRDRRKPIDWYGDMYDIRERGTPLTPGEEKFALRGMFREAMSKDDVPVSGEREGGELEPAAAQTGTLGTALTQGFDSEDAAVAAAMSAAMPLSDRYEYGGIVYEDGGRYYYSEPLTSKQTHDINIKATKPKGSRLVALYHTHPGGHKSDLFSDHDMETAEGVGVPYYMGDVAGKRIKRYRPGTKGRRRNVGEDVGQ